MLAIDGPTQDDRAGRRGEQREDPAHERHRGQLLQGEILLRQQQFEAAYAAAGEVPEAASHHPDALVLQGRVALAALARSQSLAASEATPATLVAITSLGGDFGFAGAVPGPEGGALSGLLKSIYVEDARYDHGRFNVKVIDLPVGEPAAAVVDAVCGELASARPEVEVAWSGGRRRVVAALFDALVHNLPYQPD